jgi:hypothetical protein
MSKVVKILKKIIFMQMSITSSKINIFELFENQNLSSNICPPTSFSQFLSLSFENFAVTIERSSFFKKGEKIKISKFRREGNFGKKIFYEVLISIISMRESMFKNQPNRRWSLVAWSIFTKTATQ